MTYLYPRQIFYLHKRIINITGGSHGVRDKGMLESAVYRPQATFGGQDLYPDLFMKVKRPASAVVEYQTITGEVIERELTGFECRVFLHEYDHLIGITFDERVGNLSFKMAKDKRKKEAKKKVRASA